MRESGQQLEERKKKGRRRGRKERDDRAGAEQLKVVH